MDNIVKYHNDLNKLKFYLFGELEQNILMGVFLNARFHNTKEFILNADDIAKFLPQRNPSKQEIFNRVMSLRENLFKIDYTHEIKLDNGLIELSFYNIFSVFTLVYTTENREFEYLKIKISDDFSYLIHNITKFMTQFELEEFLFLNGKYAKALYIHLKQFRTTGIWRVKWDDFKEILGIPSSYKICDIDKRILNPCVEQLSSPLNLFELHENKTKKATRTPFKNLKYTKIKGKGRGRGGAIKEIEFTFDKQTAQGEHITHFMGQEIAPSHAKEYKEPQKLEPIFIQRLREIQKKKAIIFNNQEYFILNIVEQDESFLIHLSKDAKFPKNDFYTKFSLERAEQLAKDNNLI
ncbi:MAG: replication initiation protein [Campylobacter sp.]|nr:replication initiation protein [Campylobacteraceae bacterium]MDY2817178.1 replication initiation protein [Campylobacter lanienae]MDY5303958.1 replication initiation protein [Campylobacter sp.]MDY6123710.1 replication initiation protein [Campylobacter sp.]